MEGEEGGRGEEGREEGGREGGRREGGRGGRKGGLTSTLFSSRCTKDELCRTWVLQTCTHTCISSPVNPYS